MKKVWAKGERRAFRKEKSKEVEEMVSKFPIVYSRELQREKLEIFLKKEVNSTLIRKELRKKGHDLISRKAI